MINHTPAELFAFVRALPSTTILHTIADEQPFTVEVKDDAIICKRGDSKLGTISIYDLGDLLNRASHTVDDEQYKTSTYDDHFRARSYFVAILREFVAIRAHDSKLPEEYVIEYTEGAPHQIIVNRYERDPAAREACLIHFGMICAACELSLDQFYGSEVKGLIHVHHLKPQAAERKTYILDPVSDLVPVCPNCHAVIHFGRSPENPRTIAEVRKLIAQSQSDMK